MKTLLEIKDKFAKERGRANWTEVERDLEYSIGIGKMYNELDLIDIISQLYAEEVLREAADRVCTKEVESYTNCNGDENGNLYKKEIVIDKDSILNIILEL